MPSRNPATYKDDGLPHLAAVELGLWVAGFQAGLSGDSEEAVKKDIERWAEVLRDWGYQVNIPERDGEGELTVGRKNAVGWEMAYYTWQGFAKALKRAGPGREKSYRELLAIMRGLLACWDSDTHGFQMGLEGMN